MTTIHPNQSRRLRWNADAQTWRGRYTNWLAAHRINWQKSGGLLPVVVQDTETRQVLMQGVMNPEALNQSLESGQVTFFSRSKGRLWRKGESSGNVLQIRELALDCDCDSLLILALPLGPTCHTGCNSCYSTPPGNLLENSLQRLDEQLGSDFEQNNESLGAGWLATLERIIAERLNEAKPQNPKSSDAPSYVQRLFQQGIQRMAQKVGEEGVETALAAMALNQANETAQHAKGELTAEAADLLFHLLLLLQACGLRLQDAIQALEQRHRRAIMEQKKEPAPK